MRQPQQQRPALATCGLLVGWQPVGMTFESADTVLSPVALPWRVLPRRGIRGVAWRDLPERFGPWQTVWKRHHRFATDGTWDMLLRVIQSEADAAGRVDWSVSVDSSIVRAHQHSATAKRVVREDRARREEQTGARSSDKNSRCCRDEPGDHALGRSRGGLSTKIHAAVDGRGRPLVILLTPGQAGDAPMMLPLLAGLRVGRRSGDRAPGPTVFWPTRPTPRARSAPTCEPAGSAA
jgi:transposase